MPFPTRFSLSSSGGAVKRFNRAAAVALAAILPVMIPVMIPGLTPASAEILTPSEFVIMMDYESGDILYEKNMDA
ncbi:MAG: hypothetical protein J4F41_08945, partial [Alphaproteobacteria bacterium]|nr:hypothetical protein [Alphaproteobacteria bacterium]